MTPIIQTRERSSHPLRSSHVSAPRLAEWARSYGSAGRACLGRPWRGAPRSPSAEGAASRSAPGSDPEAARRRSGGRLREPGDSPRALGASRNPPARADRLALEARRTTAETHADKRTDQRTNKNLARENLAAPLEGALADLNRSRGRTWGRAVRSGGRNLASPRTETSHNQES